MKNKISVCIITKNEAHNLEICLERLAKYDYEIVVIDTGSTDGSVELAKKYTDKVFDFVWVDDFSAARNYAIEKATNEYILMIDTDEFVDDIDTKLLDKLINENPENVGRMHRKNFYQSDGKEMTSNEYVNRLFPKSLFHYTGRIHEQITMIVDGEYKTYIAPVFTTHVGYKGDSDDRAKKADRNLRLLLIELEENPDDPYILYQIGKAYFYEQKYKEAIPYLEHAMELPLDLSLEYVSNIVITYGYCLIYTERTEDAMMLSALMDDFGENADYLFVMGLIYMYNAMFEQAIESFLKATTINKCTVEGVNSYAAFYNVGVILECLEDKANAMLYYRQCGEYGPAKEGIARILGV